MINRMNVPALGRVGRWMLAAAGCVAMSTASFAQSTPAGDAKGDAKAAAKAPEKAAPKGDRVTLRDGTVVEGTVLEETDALVKVRATIAGIKSEATFQKADVLTVERGVVTAAEEKGAEPAAGDANPAAKLPDDEASEPGVTRVYHIKLTGEFGSQISQTPLKNALKDAKKQNVQLIVIELKNDWSVEKDEERDQEGKEQSKIDEAFRSLDIAPIFTEELQREWPDHPKVVMWVRQAMGGAAFMPLVSRNIYMSSDARIGGLGRIEELFKSGDKVVIEKQMSLRLGRAEGLAIEGGIDPRIARAMALGDMVLSYRIVGGKAELLDRMPEADGEVLLTDDGKEGNADTMEQMARDEGNDVLTLDADTAFKLGISKGTVDSFEDLMTQLGVGRTYRAITKQPDAIMEQWRDRLASARREIPRLWREYNEAQAPANSTDPARQTLSMRMAKLNELIALIKRWEEAIPYPQVLGVPARAQLETLLQQHKLEMINLNRPNNSGGGGGGGRRGGGGGGGG